MLLVIAFWIIAFLNFLSIGYLILQLIKKYNKKISSEDYSISDIFFFGFLSVSMFSGLLSIFMPVGLILFLLFCCIALIGLVFFLKGIYHLLIELFKDLEIRRGWLLLVFAGIAVFVLSAVVHENILSDTGLYHTQFIKWIRTYSVVPGLGNLHGRFAFNSMFFVVSGLFSFEVGETIICPLNGIAFLVAACKLLYLIFSKTDDKYRWKYFFYIALLLLSLYILLPGLNSPSPDYIMAILIVYSFTLLIERLKNNKNDLVYVLILNMLVFTSIVYKLSSILMVLLLIPLWISSFKRNFVISFITGCLVILPFLIRNYYLSGYLIYPLPAIDIFNPDWKIPIENVIREKSWIESWARIPGKPYTEVLPLSITEWIKPWWEIKFKFIKYLLITNLFSVICMIIMLIRREYKLLILLSVLVANLVFWFLKAPDPRFVYGFLIAGASITISYVLKLFIKWIPRSIIKYRYLILIVFLIYIFNEYKYYPVHTLRNKNLWYIPTPVEKAETEVIHGEFTYRVSLSDSKCFNADIPCVPYNLNNVVMRGDNISEGFRIKNDNSKD